MKITPFIYDFFKRKGAYVFSAVVLSKFLSLMLSIVVIRLITKEDYGNLMYAYTVISFVMPFMGMGVFQSFIKYAPIQEFLYQRKTLFRYSFVGGIIASLILVVIVLIFASIITEKVTGAYGYLSFFSLLIVSLFIFESVKNYLRIFYLNKSYAQLEVIHAILIFLFGTLLTYLMGAIGFVISLVAVPLFLSIWLLVKKDFLRVTDKNINISKKTFWTYGIYTSLGGLVAQLIFSVDVISIANLMEDAKWVAQYKALSLIPFSLLFLPGAVIKTDFVKLVQEAKNRTYLISYVKSFMAIFMAVSFLFLLIGFSFGDWLIAFFFGQDYLGQSALLNVFLVGVVGAFVFRIPYGNIMVAIGWTKINTLISVFTLIADVVLNYYWINKYGIIGAAYATSLLLWVSGIFIFIAFMVYLNRLKE